MNAQVCLTKDTHRHCRFFSQCWISQEANSDIQTYAHTNLLSCDECMHAWWKIQTHQLFFCNFSAIILQILRGEKLSWRRENKNKNKKKRQWWKTDSCSEIVMRTFALYKKTRLSMPISIVACCNFQFIFHVGFSWAIPASFPGAVWLWKRIGALFCALLQSSDFCFQLLFLWQRSSKLWPWTIFATILCLL